MESSDNLIQCYNRGCGQKFDPNANAADACRHHPGAPFFHDAYKGWTCCNKKYTDFTEFLNTQGCTLAKHSNEKPPEPPKPIVDDILTEEKIKVKPIVASSMVRPPVDTSMVVMEPIIAASLKTQLETIKPAVPIQQDQNEINLGTICKNGGCNKSYEGPETNGTPCVHHPGCPIFHEGLKFWSCCQKRTSDFNAFLNQIGCQRGTHTWTKDDGDNTNVECRWDWHQTSTHVVVSVYAKQFCPKKSTIELNPVRLLIRLVFPHQNDAAFNLDAELRGIIDVNASKVSMFVTKVEIKLKKAEAGSWITLEAANKAPKLAEKKETPTKVDTLTPKIDAVDLSDL